MNPQHAVTGNDGWRPGPSDSSRSSSVLAGRWIPFTGFLPSPDFSGGQPLPRLARGRRQVGVCHLARDPYCLLAVASFGPVDLS